LFDHKDHGVMALDTVLSRPASDERTASGKISCRPIEVEDLPAVIDLLHKGFPRHGRSYWNIALQRLARHLPPPGFPRFGDILTMDGRPIGVHLLIAAPGLDDPGAPVRCNGSSWYVEDRFQSYGIFLQMRATRRQPAVYTDLDPRPRTVPMITAQGYRLYSRGLWVGLPAFAPAPKHPTRLLSGRAAWQAAGVPVPDQRMLADHEAFGCICLWCETPSGGQPVIVRRRFVKSVFPCAQLIYCRSLSEFARVARPIGLFLSARGMPFLLAPADKPISGLPGLLFPGKLLMYFKGSRPPRPTDLSYTEAAVFGM
jgi:hypothetical protein